MLKLDEPFRNQEILIISLFSIVKIFFAVFVDILHLGSGSVDPHIFAEPGPDPGSQNLADPTDPDPKHLLKVMKFMALNFRPSLLSMSCN